MHAQTGKTVYITLLLVFVRLPIYCVYTQFLNRILPIPSFSSFSRVLLFSIPSPKYQSQMTNPYFFQIAFVTSSRQSRIAMHAIFFDTQVYYYLFGSSGLNIGLKMYNFANLDFQDITWTQSDSQMSIQQQERIYTKTLQAKQFFESSF